MKTIKILLAGMLALTCARIASAQTFLKITGSTTFRKAAYDAIVHSLNNPKGACMGGSTADMSGALQAVITGTLKSGPSAGQPVVIQTAFGGSVGGVDVLIEGLITIPGVAFDSAHTWLSAAGNTLTPITVNSDGTIPGATILTAGTANFDGAAVANAANSDALQATTIFPLPSLREENQQGPTGRVSVVQFYAVKGRQSPDIPTASYNAFSDVTDQQYGLLISSGTIPLSILTGNAADGIYDVAAEGRNNDSGVRLITEAETSVGFSPNQTESLYEAIITGGSITGVNSVGDVGYTSGSSVATDLATPITAGTVDDNGVPFILVGYLGKTDKNTAVAGGAAVLKFEGSDGTNDNNTINGQYTYWSYEHIYYQGGLGTVQQNALDLIANQARLVDGVQCGLLLSTMNVSRLGDGSEAE